MKPIDYDFTDYLDALWNLYQVRGGLSSANAARRVLDLREEILVEYDNGTTAQDFFLADIEDDE